MQPVKPRPRRHDPAPSRINYRLKRLLLRAWVKRTLTVWVPLALVLLGSWLLVTHPSNQQRMDALVDSIRNAVETRPELTIKRYAIVGATVEIQARAEAVLGVTFPVSSMNLDLKAVQKRLEALPSVRSAQVTVIPNDRLLVRLEEREPRVIYRSGEALMLLDRDGYFVRSLPSRNHRPDLPLIAGGGADRVVGEALRLFKLAGPLAPRIRGLVRVGERRWTVVLDRQQSIMLPEQDAGLALQRVIALDNADELLSRDISVVDMRDGSRPIIRLSETARETLRLLRQSVPGEET